MASITGTSSIPAVANVHCLVQQVRLESRNPIPQRLELEPSGVVRAYLAACQ